jgi:hypothetical protein
MRALAAIIFLALGIAGVNAADLPTDQGENYSTRTIGYGDRAGVQVVYDFLPGIEVRPYWLATITRPPVKSRRLAATKICRRRAARPSVRKLSGVTGRPRRPWYQNCRATGNGSTSLHNRIPLR